MERARVGSEKPGCPIETIAVGRDSRCGTGFAQERRWRVEDPVGLKGTPALQRRPQRRPVARHRRRDQRLVLLEGRREGPTHPTLEALLVERARAGIAHEEETPLVTIGSDDRRNRPYGAASDRIEGHGLEQSPIERRLPGKDAECHSHSHRDPLLGCEKNRDRCGAQRLGRGAVGPELLDEGSRHCLRLLRRGDVVGRAALQDRAMK